jgi:hypothetical protein
VSFARANGLAVEPDDWKFNRDRSGGRKSVGGENGVTSMIQSSRSTFVLWELVTVHYKWQLTHASVSSGTRYQDRLDPVARSGRAVLGVTDVRSGPCGAYNQASSRRDQHGVLNPSRRPRWRLTRIRRPDLSASLASDGSTVSVDGGGKVSGDGVSAGEAFTVVTGLPSRSDTVCGRHRSRQSGRSSDIYVRRPTYRSGLDKAGYSSLGSGIVRSGRCWTCSRCPGW